LRASLEEDLESAHDTMEILAQVGISMAAVTATLLDEGVRLFAEPFDKLLDALAPRGANS
jgi:transaldolase/glucose-6-phosphate isomerase